MEYESTPNKQMNKRTFPEINYGYISELKLSERHSAEAYQADGSDVAATETGAMVADVGVLGSQVA